MSPGSKTVVYKIVWPFILESIIPKVEVHDATNIYEKVVDEITFNEIIVDRTGNENKRC